MFSGLLTIDFFRIQSSGGERFDDCEVGPGTRSWGDESVKVPTLIKVGLKWAPQSCTAEAVAPRRTFLPYIEDGVHWILGV